MNDKWIMNEAIMNESSAWFLISGVLWELKNVQSRTFRANSNSQFSFPHRNNHLHRVKWFSEFLLDIKYQIDDTEHFDTEQIINYRRRYSIPSNESILLSFLSITQQQHLKLLQYRSGNEYGEVQTDRAFLGLFCTISL